MTKELRGKALFMALRNQRPPAGPIHHSDRGSQYCAYAYGAIQEQFGLKTSMSDKGNCYDNAPIESFRGTLKNESLSHYRFKSRDEAISVIRVQQVSRFHMSSLTCNQLYTRIHTRTKKMINFVRNCSMQH